jgi:acyl-CoA thioesterase
VAHASDPAIPNRARLDALFRGDRYLRGHGAELVGWGGGWAAVRWTPDATSRDVTGAVHSGAVFAVADLALSVAGNSWGRLAVALTVQIHHLRPPDGVPLVARAVERSRGRSAASYLIDVTQEGVLVASAHAVGHRTSRWHFGEDAWPADWREQH